MFVSELQKALTANPDANSLIDRRLLKIVNGKDTPRRRRVLRRMEEAVAEHLGQNVDTIDWSTINWSEVILTVVQILAALLPLLLAL